MEPCTQFARVSVKQVWLQNGIPTCLLHFSFFYRHFAIVRRLFISLCHEIITKINSFSSGLIDKLGYVKSCEIEKDRFLFADQHGYRKSQFFSNKGSDNVHLNQNGVVRLANHLKYTAHDG